MECVMWKGQHKESLACSGASDVLCAGASPPVSSAGVHLAPRMFWDQEVGVKQSAEGSRAMSCDGDSAACSIASHHVRGR